MAPQTILAISVAWSLKTCVNLNLKALKIRKGFMPTKAKMLVWVWSLFGSLRRTLSIVVLFIPCLGLFDTLYHWNAELIPFRVR